MDFLVDLWTLGCPSYMDKQARKNPEQKDPENKEVQGSVLTKFHSGDILHSMNHALV